MKTDWEARRDIIACARQVYNKGIVAATDGNISYRMMTDRVMITPSGTSFANLTTDELAYVDIDGNILNFEQNPSSDARFIALSNLIDNLLREDGAWKSDERIVVFTEYKTTLDYLLRR